MSQLPLEIWVLIIDNLAEDQGRASSKVLAACSLVETRLIPLARKHLFEKLRFRARTLRQADARFQELEPVIAPYVRTFDVVCYNTVHDGEPMEFAKYVSLLATAVGSQVDTLILSRVSIPAWHKDSSMPLCTQAFPQLHHLCFDGVDFQNVDLMAHYLASCPLLRSFRLDGCDFENVDFRQEYALPPIQELVLYLNSHLDHILSWATRLGLASSLRCLKVRSFKDEDHEALAAFVATPSLQLSVLHIAIEYQWQFSVTYVSPAFVSSSLTSLEMSCERYVGGSVVSRLGRFPVLQCLSVLFSDWPLPETLEDRVRACASMKILVAAREKGVLCAYFAPSTLYTDVDSLHPGSYFDGNVYRQRV